MERKIIWKLNIIDLVLIAVVGLSLIALVFKLTWGKPSNDTEAYLFTYVCDSAPTEVYQGLGSGSFCKDAETGTNLGKLTNLILTDIPNKDKQKHGIFISALEGVKGEHGILVDDVTYLKGQELELVVDDSVFSVYLSQIQSIE